MAMTCPRCETTVSDQSLYCPYCSLPKPKNGFAASPKETSVEQPDNSQARPSREAHRRSGVVPSPQKAAKPQSNRAAAGRRSSRTQSPARRLRLPVLIGAALVALLSVGSYMYVVPLIRSDGADPKAALSTLEKFRRLPSNDSNLTVEARMAHELEQSRRAGRLVSYQGWTTQRIKGTKTKVLLVFSYQETGGIQQRAEWLADFSANAFTPQNELAAAVYGKQ